VVNTGKFKIGTVCLISYLISLFIAWRTVLQMNLPIGFDDYVKQLILLINGYRYSLNPIILSIFSLSRFYDWVTSIKLIVALAYSLIPISIFIYMYELFRDRFVSFLSSLLALMFAVSFLNSKYFEGVVVAILLPIFLTFLYKLHSRGGQLYIIGLVVVCILTLLSELRACYLLSAILTIFVIYRREKLFKLLPSLILSYALMIYHVVIVGVQFSYLPMDLINPILFIAIICTGVGLYLTIKSREILLLTIIPVILIIVLLPIADYFLALLNILSSSLTSFLASFCRGFVKSYKVVENGGEVRELALNLNKLIPIVLILILIATSIHNTRVFIESYQTFPWMSSTIYDVSSIVTCLASPNSYVITSSSLSAWVEGLTGLRVLNNYGYDLEVDTITSTSYRLINSYIMVDETNPASPAYAPRVRVYDGEYYLNSIAINDSNVLVTVSNKTLNIANHVINTYMNGLNLTVFYGLPSLTIKKIEALSRDSPILNITYILNAEGNAQVGIRIPIYAYNALFTVDDDGFLAIGRDRIRIIIKSNGVIDTTILNETLIVSSSSRGVLKLDIMFTFLSAKNSNIQPCIYSTMDLLRNLNVSCIVASRRMNNFLSLLQREEIAVLELDESMVSILGDQYFQPITAGNITIANTNAIYETSNFVVCRRILSNSIVYEVESRNSTLHLFIVKYVVPLSNLRWWLINKNKAVLWYKDLNVTLTFSKGFHDVEYKSDKIICTVIIPLDKTKDVISIDVTNADISISSNMIQIHTMVGFLNKITEISKEFTIYKISLK
jgi:hypothetical protein